MEMLIQRSAVPFLLLILLFMHRAGAETISTWQVAKVSEEITRPARGEGDSAENLLNDFSNKSLTLRDNTLLVGDYYTCEVGISTTSTMKHWLTTKTVNFFRDFFRVYGVELGTTFEVIAATRWTQDCPYPFAEIFRIDNTLVVFYKSRAVFYSLKGDTRFTRDSDVATAPGIIEQPGGVICHEGSNEAEVVFDVGFIVTCLYPDTDLLSTYKKFREKYKKDNILKLLKEDISPGQDIRVEIAADFIFEYKWASAHELKIEIFQPGGVDTLVFMQKMSGTTVKSISSPD